MSPILLPLTRALEQLTDPALFGVVWRSALFSTLFFAAIMTGTVAIVGRPNVGKSTLLNHLIGAHVAITSRKAQTTRHRIQGILTDPISQFIFVDTPGYQTQHANALNRLMNRTVGQVACEVDVVVFVIDAGHWDPRDEPLLGLIPEKAPVILALNKVDKVDDKTKIAETLVEANAKRDFAALVPISASKGTQLKALLAEIRARLPQREAIYGADEITDKSERFLAAVEDERHDQILLVVEMTD